MWELTILMQTCKHKTTYTSLQPTNFCNVLSVGEANKTKQIRNFCVYAFIGVIK